MTESLKERRVSRALELIDEGEKVEAVAEALGFSLQQFYRWRYKDKDVHRKLKKAIKERDRRPDSSSKKVSMFRGTPDCDKELERRKKIVLAMRKHSIGESGSGARPL